MTSPPPVRIARLLPVLLAAILSACGGGGGGAGGGGDATPPRVSSTSVPDGAENVGVGTTIQVVFSEAVRNVDNTTFRLEGGGTPVNGTVVHGGTTATFTPSANLDSYTRYTATVTTGVTDLANNPLAANHVWSFTTGAPPDTTPPRVIATSPPAGQTDVGINAMVMATFSEAVRNVDNTTFRLESGGTPVTGTVIPNGTSATFAPAAPLGTLTTYTATVTTGVTDLANNHVATDCSWTFTTGAAPDTTPPVVTATAPSVRQAGVPISTRVQVTFSEAVRNIRPDTFQLRDGAGTTVPGTLAAAGNTATFTPSANLAHLATYTATATTGVTDLAGNPLAAEYGWFFTTAPSPGACLACHGGADGSQPGINGAPVVTRYWQTSGHGMGVRGPALACEDCHDAGTPVGTHAANGTGTLNTLSWPGKPSVTTNANTAHLNNFFFPVPPAAAADYAAAFDDACNNRVGCHARAGGGRNAKTMRHAKWTTEDPDYLMEFGTHSSIQNPKTFSWYTQITYADDFFRSQSPWIIGDLTTDAAGPPHYGTCVSCHDPHGTGTTDNNDAGRNVMLRGNWKTDSQFCWLSCHQ